MFKKTFLNFILSVALIHLAACSGSTETSTASFEDSSNAGQTELAVAPTFEQDTNLVLAFEVDLTIYPENTDDFGETVLVALPETYRLPLSVGPNGKLRFYARDFPALRYNICHVDSTSRNCDRYVDIENFVDMGLILDSCDTLVKDHSECGENDLTQYQCDVLEDNTFECNGIAIRPRIFFNSTTGSNVYTATPTQSGAISDLSRITLNLTTETITLNGASATGEDLEDSNLLVIGYGNIPEKTIGELPALGLSAFLADIEGEFNLNPFDFVIE